MGGKKAVTSDRQVHLPFAPVLLQKSGSQGPRRNPARERMAALLGCGSAPGHLPQRLYPLQGRQMERCFYDLFIQKAHRKNTIKINVFVFLPVQLRCGRSTKKAADTQQMLFQGVKTCILWLKQPFSNELWAFRIKTTGF